MLERSINNKKLGESYVTTSLSQIHDFSPNLGEKKRGRF